MNINSGWCYSYNKRWKIQNWYDLIFNIEQAKTHYVIDFFSGYVFARLLCRFSEKLSYYFDVKLLGYRK